MIAKSIVDASGQISKNIASFCFPVYKDDTLTMISVATVNANEHAHIYFIA